MNSKKKGPKANYLWTGIILVCLLIVLFSLIYASVTGGDKEPSATPPANGTETASPENSTPPSGGEAPNVAETDGPTPPPTVLAETEDMGQEYLDKFFFLGDSTTNGLATYSNVDKSRVLTPSNGTFSLFNQSIITIWDRINGGKFTIEETFERIKPEYLLITLGVNGVAMMDEEWFKNEYTALIERIQNASPDTKIILNSIYPFAEKYTDISMDKNRMGNVWIEELAQQTGLRFLNSSAALIGEDGYLPENLTNGDGLHLNAEAFNLIFNYIRTHGYR